MAYNYSMTRFPNFLPPRWGPASQMIVLKIRWFGLILGYAYVNFGSAAPDRGVLNAILGLGAVYTILNTWFSAKGRPFLDARPLAISFLEALFIGLLCYFDNDLSSPFRYYYLLSLICCAMRHSRRVTLATCLVDCLSYGALWFWLDPGPSGRFELLLLPIILIWATWAASALSRLMMEYNQRLEELNDALRDNQHLLEDRIAERTGQLQETQAQLMHQEKMAGFGLLAAGIAHEVGNPLTSISTLVQILERRDCDDYTREKLGLVAGQLSRIQGILRELMNFSRPANMEPTRFTAGDIVDEALNIAKYYRGVKSRVVKSAVPADLPAMVGVRDQITQVVFNLLLNAIDATGKGGVIEVSARESGDQIIIAVRDDGPGIAREQRGRVFQPYFTTKKQGTGLGLFMARRLVAQHGGQIGFESFPGAGATFHFSLPIARSASEIAGARKEVEC
jgi:signal transduction histidine kinase